ncbi:MAG: xanthine dehydrogenase family protein molybdopterin-binding subunit [Chloroflexi bacterium]|nr:xanthine dehydrogenase family protein molybdopterin-binding subunit [Chloroflexota bacterium]
MEKLNTVGKSSLNVNAEEKVLGQALYGVDIKLPGMLYGKIMRSKHFHARILSVDTRKAEKVPGVKAILHSANTSSSRCGSFLEDQGIFHSKVRFTGEPVAAVAALTEEAAEEAIQLIDVQYEELPPVFDPIEAMKPNAPVIHEDLDTYEHIPICYPVKGTNICHHFRLNKGDVEKAFREADFVFEDTFTAQMIQHACMEPHAAVATVGAGGKVTIWASLPKPYELRAGLAKVFGLPMSKVRAIVPYVGGSFGGKNFMTVEPYCVALAQRTRRPVKIVMTREEEFVVGPSRHPGVIRVKTGVMKDGTIIGRQLENIWDTGAYAAQGPAVTNNSGLAAAGPYEIPNVKVDAYCVYTNKTIAGAFRGFGVPQLAWALESQMDVIAERLGMDAREFRLKNMLGEGGITATGEVVRSVGVGESLQAVVDKVGWGKGKVIPNRGKGFACMHKPSAAGTASEAFVKINEDGSAEIYTSAADPGQGSDTVLTQIAAEELGIPMDAVSIVNPDTESTPYDYGTVSSRVTFHAGNAVRKAAIEARNELLDLAAQRLEAKVGDLECQNSAIFVKGSPEKAVGIAELAMAGYKAKGSHIMGRCTFRLDTTPLHPETGQAKKPAPFWMYLAQATEVEVDSETGVVNVLNMVSAQDAGKALNPLSVEAQMEGGLVTGWGCAMTEEVSFDGGRILNPSFTDYRLPTAMDDFPQSSSIVEVPHPDGPYGAKGMAETGLVCVAPALGNAIYRAVGVRIKDMPITPERVWKAIKEIETGTK